MAFIILSSTNGDWGDMFFSMFLLFGGISLIALLYSYAISTKEAKGKGGIKGMYPSVIKFIAQYYPNTRIVIDTILYITMESNDSVNGVVRKFTLRLNPDTCKLTVKGSVIPDNSRWAWIPQTNYNWLIGLPTWEPAHYETTIIEQIKKGMVFIPNGSCCTHQQKNNTEILSLAQFLNFKECDINFMKDIDNNIVGKLSNGERIQIDIQTQKYIKSNGLGILSDYVVEKTICEGAVDRFVIKLKYVNS